MSKTSRELRCEVQEWETDKNKEYDVLKFKDGFLTKNILVQGNKLILNFKRSEGDGCYPDDALAIIRDILCSFPKKDEETSEAISLIQEAIETLDKRALKRHGYDASEEEQKYKPPYTKFDVSNLTI